MTFLNQVAKALVAESALYIIAENAGDMANAKENGIFRLCWSLALTKRS